MTHIDYLDHLASLIELYRAARHFTGNSAYTTINGVRTALPNS